MSVCGQVEPTHLWSGCVEDSRETNEKQAEERVRGEPVATFDVMTGLMSTALPQQVA